MTFGAAVSSPFRRLIAVSAVACLLAATVPVAAEPPPDETTGAAATARTDAGSVPRGVNADASERPARRKGRDARRERFQAARAAHPDRVDTERPKFAPAAGQFQVNTFTSSFQGETDIAMAPNGDFVAVWTSYGSPDDDTAYTSIQMQRYASDGTPLASQMQVNSMTSGYQYLPNVAADGAGNFVVVWTNYDYTVPGAFSEYIQLRGRRFDSAGSPLAGDFQVDTFTPGYPYNSSIEMASDGRFVVAWESYYSPGSDNDSWSIQARRYDSGGNALASQFQVNDLTGGYQEYPDVTMRDDGSFLVVWDSDESAGTDTDLDSIQGHLVDAAGADVGTDFQVNSYTTDGQTYPRVDTDLAGDFMVTWMSYGSAGTDTEFFSVQARRVDSTGVPQAADFQVNTSTTYDQVGPDVAFAGSEFFVVWTDTAGPGGGGGMLRIDGPTDSSSRLRPRGGAPTAEVRGQRFDAGDAVVGSELAISTVTNAFRSRVDRNPAGHGIVGWMSDDSAETDNSFFSSQARLYVTTADLVVTKDDGVTTAIPGGQVIYTITVENQGPDTVADALVTDTFPASLACSWTSVASGGASGNTDSAGDLSDTLELPSGGQVVYTVTCQIDPSATGMLVNTAEVSSVADDPSPGDESDTDTDTLTPMADLELVKTAAPDPVAPDNLLTYTLTVTNLGPSTSTGGQVVDTLPAGLSFDSSADCTELAGTVTCPFGTLLPTASAVLTFDVLVDAAVADTTVTNAASVTGNEPDPVPGNNDDAAPVDVSSVVTDLQLAKSAAPDPVEPGGIVTYSLTVTNLGPGTSTGGQVIDVLPPELTFDSSADCTELAGTVTCPFGMLAPLASVVLTFDALVDPGAADTTVTNAATVSANEADPAGGNDASGAPVLVGPPPPPTVEVPILSSSGLALLGLLLAGLGLVAIRRLG